MGNIVIVEWHIIDLWAASRLFGDRSPKVCSNLLYFPAKAESVRKLQWDRPIVVWNISCLSVVYRLLSCSTLRGARNLVISNRFVELVQAAKYNNFGVEDLLSACGMSAARSFAEAQEWESYYPINSHMVRNCGKHKWNRPIVVWNIISLWAVCMLFG